jgi:6-phosphogluconolactonase (cycloisomerase 2 family)
VRIFAIEAPGLTWKTVTPLKAAPGSGPRHVAFLKTETKTFLYLISELTNTITAYEVKYSEKELGFTELFVIPTHGAGNTVPTGASAAEIQVSVSLPDPYILTYV